MSKVVQYDGVLYSLSNRRLYVLRVVANLTKGGITCKAHLYPGNHPRVQELRYDHRLRKVDTKWGRAFSTTCCGLWVHVYSKYRWRQEPPPAYTVDYGPLQSIREEEDAGEDVAVGKRDASPEQEVPEAMATVKREPRPTDSEQGTTDVKELQLGWLVAEAEPRVQWQMLFEVLYGGGEYATELARLCREYGVTGTSSSKYKVQGFCGKDFTLVFFEQPQLEPDAEKTDFPLSVWTTQDRVSGAGTVEGHLDTQEEAELHGVNGFSEHDEFRVLGSTEYYDISDECFSEHDECYSEHDPATPSTADSDHDPATPSTADSDQDVVSLDAPEAVEKGAGARRRKRWNKMP